MKALYEFIDKLKLYLLILLVLLLIYLYFAVDWAAVLPAVDDLINIGLVALVLGCLVFIGIKYKEATDKSYETQVSSIQKIRAKHGNISHGSADFADSKELRKADKFGLATKDNKGLILGRFAGKFIRFNTMGHLITFAPTRSGKGVGQVIPNLLDHPGSVIVNDIKGENYAVSARHRSTFTKVYKFAPFQKDSDCYNPIDFVRMGTPEELDDIRMIADMMIKIDNTDDPFWATEAKNLVTGLIHYVAVESPPALRNLGEVRYLLMQDKKAFELTVKAMQRSKNSHVRRAAGSISATEAKVLASVLSTAKSQTAVWDSPNLVRITSRSDFQLEDLKKEPISLYIIIPPEYLSSFSAAMRLMVGLTCVAMTRIAKRPKDPVLFLIDEFPALGTMEVIETGIGYLAGYGVWLWMFVQDLSQIKANYQKWESLIANCSVRVAFGTNDVETAKVLSDMMGTTTIDTESYGKSGVSINPLASVQKSVNTSTSQRQLMTPDEVMRIDFNTQLVFTQGFKPVLAEKIMYFQDPEFKGKFDRWDG